MAKMIIERFKEGAKWTIGKFELIGDNSYVMYNGFSLEPAGADETRSGLDKRIPQGEYNAVFEYSPRFKQLLPVLYNEKVSKSRRILIHVGNHGDNTEGCILLGDSWANGWVYDSKFTVGKVLEKLGKEPFKIEIKNKIIS